jgi:hypothetical protein
MGRKKACHKWALTSVLPRQERNGRGSRFPTTPPTSLAEAKRRQSDRIKELKSALENAGLSTLDEQAKALGVGRSTAWSILKGNHKASGLSGAIVRRMLSAPFCHVRYGSRFSNM